MACMNCETDGGGCGSGCSCSSSLPLKATGAASCLCIKCKDGVPAITVGNQTEPMCASCLYVSLLSKFKTAVNNHGLITPSDNVLVAVSGGPASRVAVEMLKEIRSKAQSDADASKDGTMKVFRLGVVYVDEATVLRLPESEAEAAVNSIKEMYDGIPVHTVELDCVYGTDGLPSDEDGDSASSKLKLTKLFESVKDMTGKEDMLELLRMQAIQTVAQISGYTKVVLALTATRIAAKVIAATTKGQGYSLPAFIQYLDGRWPIPVVLPLRDCVARELALHCHIAKLTTIFVRGLTTMADPRSSLNNLAHHFITLLQEENPSREHTIVRTAAKLTSFSFNAEVVPPSRRRRNPRNHDKGGGKSELSPEFLCSICRAPLQSSDMSPQTETTVGNGRDSSGNYADMKSTCCPSCLFQIFPEDGVQAEEKYLLFPDSTRKASTSTFSQRQKWMRSQIQDYLLPEETSGLFEYQLLFLTTMKLLLNLHTTSIYPWISRQLLNDVY
ncbi:hypothetical protein R1flu_025143 [Riccia fluitans]|uniref:Cytoplasmic tRNA 2-thiolation protein 2 n=1 Tax=Riccia fluitans TaxID=41844 RepID=A0ABD1XZZ0_9MARC